MAKLSKIEARKAQAIERLEKKIDLILAHLGIDLSDAQVISEPAADEPSTSEGAPEAGQDEANQ